MTNREYQVMASRTMPRPYALDNFVYGLVGEVGEVVDEIKKQRWHGHDEDIDKIAEEIGDAMWYIAAIATYYGLDLTDVCERNIAKLRERYPMGFAPRDSIERRV